MTLETLRADIEGARTHARLDELAPRIWRDVNLESEEGQELAAKLAEAVHARRRAIDADGSGPLRQLGTALQGRRRSIFTPRIHQVSPDKAQSRDRRRKLALSGPMPPALASRFTLGHLAVLGAVANEVMRSQGVCTLCVEAIAAQAGVSRRLAQAALRLAEGDGLLSIEERPRKGQPHDTNRIRILSREWRAWIERRHRGELKRAAEAAAKAAQGGGCKKVRPSDNGDTFGGPVRPARPSFRAAEGEQAGPSARPLHPPRFAERPARKGRQHAPGAWGRSA